MSHTYNIQVEIDPQSGFITSFPFRQRWLRGEEYGFLCRHYYAYSQLLECFKIKNGEHPEEIYHNPKCKFTNLFQPKLFVIIFYRWPILLLEEYAPLILWIPQETLGHE